MVFGLWTPYPEHQAFILALGRCLSPVKRAFAPSAIYRFLMTNFDQRISKGIMCMASVQKLEAPRCTPHIKRAYAPSAECRFW